MKARSGGPGSSGARRPGSQWKVPGGESKPAVGRGSGLRCRHPPSPPLAAIPWSSQLHLPPARTQGHTQAHAHEPTGTSNTPESRFRQRSVSFSRFWSSCHLTAQPQADVSFWVQITLWASLLICHQRAIAFRMLPEANHFSAPPTATSLAWATLTSYLGYGPQTPVVIPRSRSPCFHPLPPAIYSLTSQRDPFKLKPDCVTPPLRNLQGQVSHSKSRGACEGLQGPFWCEQSRPTTSLIICYLPLFPHLHPAPALSLPAIPQNYQAKAPLRAFAHAGTCTPSPRTECSSFPYPHGCSFICSIFLFKRHFPRGALP